MIGFGIDFMPECPRCNNEIDYLNYSVPVREIGTYNGEDWETGDSEWNGEPSFSCPECDEPIFVSTESAEDFLLGSTRAERAERRRMEMGTLGNRASPMSERRRDTDDEGWGDMENPTTPEQEIATAEGDLPGGENW